MSKKIYAMSPTDVHAQLEEPLMLFRTYLDRMTYTMQDLMEGYFQNPNVNPECKDDWWVLAHGFKRNATRAEIVDDAISHLRSVLSSLEALDRWIDEEASRPVGETTAPADKPSSDTPNIRKLAEYIVKNSPRSRATSAERGGAKV